MAGTIVVFGATGYTGRLVAGALVRRGARPVLAARRPEALTALAEELGGLETRVADVAQPATVHDLVERGDVLVSTVGPFLRFGEPAVAAAVARGAHYLDSTGEPPFIRRVFEEHGPRAERAGCGLLTAFGYDWVPGNLAGALALRDAGEQASRVQVGYFVTGDAGPAGMSGGTRASAGGVFFEGSFAWRGGRMVSERGAARVNAMRAGGRERRTVSVGGSEHFALPRLHPGLRDVEVGLGWFGPASRAVQALSLGASALRRLPPAEDAVRGLVRRLSPGSTGGPDAAARARSGSLVVGRALDAGGTVLAEAVLEGVNGYDFTGEVLAWGATTIAAGGLQGTGALGPVDAFGLDALERGVAEAGIARTS